MHKGFLILAAAIFAILLVSPVYAQDAGTGTIILDGQDELPSGGGEGGQFPGGTDNCSGSRYHHSHDYPGRFSCSKQVNPHYSQTRGTGSCSQRSKEECGCEDCCRKQTAESKSCFCAGDTRCKALAEYAETNCKGGCLSTYLDVCNDPDFTET